MGVCNGFQVLVRLGLLPNTTDSLHEHSSPEATLIHNERLHYIDRWVKLKVDDHNHCPFLKGLDFLQLPVRHGEGKILFRGDEEKKKVIARGLNCLSYVDQDDHPTQSFPENPNGSELACAGLTDLSGHVFGLMPHPEAFLSLYNHPNWGQLKRRRPHRTEDGDGLIIFQNIVSEIARKK